jgi:hypothetical protein
MRRGLMPVALGLTLGLEIALVFSRSLAGLLYVDHCHRFDDLFSVFACLC